MGTLNYDPENDNNRIIDNKLLFQRGEKEELFSIGKDPCQLSFVKNMP